MKLLRVHARLNETTGARRDGMVGFGGRQFQGGRDARFPCLDPALHVWTAWPVATCRFGADSPGGLRVCCAHAQDGRRERGGGHCGRSRAWVCRAKHRWCTSSRRLGPAWGRWPPASVRGRKLLKCGRQSIPDCTGSNQMKAAFPICSIAYPSPLAHGPFRSELHHTQYLPPSPH